MNAATLRLAVVPRTGLLAEAVLILGGALFLALCSQISFEDRKSTRLNSSH